MAHAFTEPTHAGSAACRPVGLRQCGQFQRITERARPAWPRSSRCRGVGATDGEGAFDEAPLRRRAGTTIAARRRCGSQPCRAGGRRWRPCAGAAHSSSTTAPDAFAPNGPTGPSRVRPAAPVTGQSVVLANSKKAVGRRSHHADTAGDAQPHSSRRTALAARRSGQRRGARGVDGRAGPRRPSRWY